MFSELGSIYKYIWDINNVHVYYQEMPENFTIPSMYFPRPEVIPRKHSLGEYKNNYKLYIKIFDIDTTTAWDKAFAIENTIMANKCLVPVLNVNGDVTKNYISINGDINITKISEGVVQITISWDGYYKYNRPDTQLIQQFFINTHKRG